MDSIEIHTLIDITKTHVDRPRQGSQLELDQNRNFNTLRQCAEMRSIIIYDQYPTVEEQDISKLGFGSAYRGTHRMWRFCFSPDRDMVYRDEQGNDLGFLLADIHAVPVIQNLTETINITRSMFDCMDSKYKNTIIKAITGTTEATA